MSLRRPLVSIITVNYNQEKETGELLQSIRKSDYRNVEVFVTDNASANNPSEYILNQFPEVHLLLNPINSGFAGGNNYALPKAQGDYFFFVNNDAEIAPDTISLLLKAFEEKPDAGIISPKILFFEKDEASSKSIIQYAGTDFLHPVTGRNKTIGEHEIDRGQYKGIYPTAYAHGAGMMVSREALQKAGMMDENFFLYYEELDWCEQIRDAGFDIYVQADASIRHKESLSVGKESPLKIQYQTRNRILFMRRRAGALNLLLFTFFFIFVSIPKNILTFLMKGQFNLIFAFLRGVFWHLSNPTAGKVIKNEYLPSHTLTIKNSISA